MDIKSRDFKTNVKISNAYLNAYQGVHVIGFEASWLVAMGMIETLRIIGELDE